METILVFYLVMAASVITVAALGVALLWAVAVVIVYCCAGVAFLIAWALSKIHRIYISVRGLQK